MRFATERLPPPEDGQTGRGLFDAVEPTSVLGDTISRTFDLPLAGLAAQLRHQLVDLR